jgi:hypothetical protein
MRTGYVCSSRDEVEDNLTGLDMTSFILTSACTLNHRVDRSAFRTAEVKGKEGLAQLQGCRVVCLCCQELETATLLCIFNYFVFVPFHLFLFLPFISGSMRYSVFRCPELAVASRVDRYVLFTVESTVFRFSTSKLLPCLKTMADKKIGITESPTLERIGSGSFATIFVLRGQPFAYKVVQHVARTDELRTEFHSLHKIYLNCNSGSIFGIPRAIAFYHPSTEEFIGFPASPPLGRPRASGASVKRTTFSESNFSGPMYAMDRVHIVPVDVGVLVRNRFYPDNEDRYYALPLPPLLRQDPRAFQVHKSRQLPYRCGSVPDPS